MGKTVVASAIIAAMREAGARVAPMKPVGLLPASGAPSDAERMRAASGIAFPIDLIQPYAFPDSASPLVSSRRARARIDTDRLDGAFAELCTLSDAIVVEDSLGLLAPITETESFATMFRRWGLDLVIVSPNSIGAVNHIMLVMAAAQAHGLRVRAVVLNTMNRERGGSAERTNQALMKELLLTVPVIGFPYTASPDDPRQLMALARELSAHATIARPA
ncbi:MAG: dethiobiotin synthase [Gemmatimonadota bacterium]|nr:dethiobiotin synthase [Gemmatimonadota bacterium]